MELTLIKQTVKHITEVGPLLVSLTPEMGMSVLYGSIFVGHLGLGTFWGPHGSILGMVTMLVGHAHHHGGFGSPDARGHHWVLAASLGGAISSVVAAGVIIHILAASSRSDRHT